MSNNVELIDNSNSNNWNKWIEKAISKRLIKYYEFKDFSNIQEIGSGGFAKVYRANWKKSHIRYAIKSFIKIDNATAKAIVREIQLHREVDHHDNIIRFYGVTTSIKENQRKEYSLVIEYADNGTLRNYLKKNLKNLNWNDKYKLAFQLVHANSNNVLVHQHAVKLSDFGLSKRVEETSNSQSKTFGLIPYTDPKSFNENIKPLYLLNKKSDIYSIGVLLWELSSGHPPFHDRTPYGVCLAISISQGHRETPIPETSEGYIKIYTDCWNIEPDNRPTINQVVDELKKIITKENIIIKDFYLYDENKGTIQPSSYCQSNSATEILETSYCLLHDNSSQVIDFTKIKEIKSSMPPNKQTENSFNIIVNDIINFFENSSSKIGKQEVLNYFNNQNITLQEINNLLLNNQNISNYIFMLGKFSLLGIGADIDKKKAFGLYQKAADLGSASGICNLGYCYQKGIGTDIDKKKAFELYQKAADLGNAFGINKLGYCYQKGIGTDIDKIKAFVLYQKVTDLGNVSGIYYLGYCYQNGIGIDIDKKKAFELYQKAADLGNTYGIYYLGYCYQSGIGVDIDKKRSFKLYQKAADLGSASGISSLGYCYQNGIGTDIDKKRAFELYQKAADLGSASGISSLGYCYQKGIGTDIDKKKAFVLYQKAADLGNTYGIYSLGRCYQNGIGIDIDKKKAFELYQKAADLGNTYGICYLGYCYQSGIGVDIDKKRSFKLYQKAADLGSASGISSLGYCYQNGIGTDIDKKRAFELYQKAADLGSASGISSLGYCYQKGIGTDIDKKKAFVLYQKAADLGNTYGIYSLGRCYQKGIGIDIDKKRAFDLYQKAADLGNSTAQYKLTLLHIKNGKSIFKNIYKAIYWYKKSTKQGN
ncbi:hypothetical protein RclHR1_00280042 [Rhizophagus clarus]|uniref:Protein kinase domain-containing protein n=1 Tax=Rhizophagus clarus TaxID=94130 RepID=A0A2Z6R3F4_9GLOM|nr:hypothetical protein RclHR1_00280042 [Rhizophagus clarus]